MENLVCGLLIILFILIIYWGITGCVMAEKFNQNFTTSVLMKKMDYDKDKIGMTLDDYILEQHTLTGAGVESPFEPIVIK